MSRDQFLFLAVFLISSTLITGLLRGALLWIREDEGSIYATIDSTSEEFNIHSGNTNQTSEQNLAILRQKLQDGRFPSDTFEIVGKPVCVEIEDDSWCGSVSALELRSTPDVTSLTIEISRDKKSLVTRLNHPNKRHWLVNRQPVDLVYLGPN